VLTGVSAAIVGSSARTRVHSAVGVLTGQNSLIVGSAARFRAFEASGVLSGQGSVVEGIAARNHTATGVLVGDGSQITGEASRSSSAVIHDASGDLSGQGSSVVGSSDVAKKFYGGFLPYRPRKSAKEIEQERIRLGIIPAPVAKVVAKAAQAAVAQATRQEEPDVIKWAEDNEAIYQSQIRRDIELSDMIWDKSYRRLFEIAIHDALTEEEDVIHLLMGSL
jgi:hypothetical protein